MRNRCVQMLVVLYGLAFAGSGWANVLVNPPYTVDDLKIVEGASALLKGAGKLNIQAVRNGRGVAVGSARKGDRLTTGGIMLEPIEARFPFNEAVPSWNADCPAGAGFRVWMRYGGPGGDGPWFEAGTWGTVPDETTTRTAALPLGKYDTDTLLLNQPCNKLQFRFDLFCAPDGASPVIRMVALSYSNTTGDQTLWKKFGSSKPALSKALTDLKTTEALKIPFRSQVVSEKGWTSRVCSAAATAMVLAYYGTDVPVLDMARLLHDRPVNGFGVWHRTVQGPAQLGLRGYITRFRNWDDVRAQLKKNSAVCASIRFKLDEISELPQQYRKRGTEGHIVVIKGFAPGGRVIVQNSGSKDWGPDQLWRQDDLARAWFDKGGVAFVFTGPVAKKPR
jgi:hypothetical protein